MSGNGLKSPEMAGIDRYGLKWLKLSNIAVNICKMLEMAKTG